jgi:oxygen-independent coproporphyrinogen III oxidase
LMCHGHIDTAAIEARFRIDFKDYFHEALEQLQPHFADGLVRVAPDRIVVTASGQLLLRSIAMCFDAYLSTPRGLSTVASLSRIV